MNDAINTQDIYDSLKDFQKITVDFAYERLQENGRFLVADEVGLGKTMIAKGVIAKTYDALKDEQDRIEIVYITTNQSIASQNIETLKIGNSETKTKRLSLLVTTLDENKENKIQFRSFTVGTSLEFKGSSTGLKEEREFLIYLLKKTELVKRLRTSTLNSFFKQTATEIDTKRDFVVPDKFISMFAELVNKKYPNLKERISLDKDSPNIIKELRKLLVIANLQYLKADLIILDEFQRFSKLLTDEESEDNEIIKILFNRKENLTKTLLLSATPYKLLDCKNNEHYDEFYTLIEWLNGDKEKVNNLKKLFKESSLKNKTDIENILKEVMCRTERTSFSSPDGMVEWKEIENVKLKTVMGHFLKEYQKYHNLGIIGLTRYLKSSPAPINYMKKDSYKSKRDFNSFIGDKSNFIANNKHPKLEMLKQEVKNQSLESYIWMPPLNPYVKTRGVSNSSSTKILLFSQWDFAPDSIVGSFANKEKKRYINYTDIKSFKDRGVLLEVTTQGKSPYDYKGILSFTQLVKQTKESYNLSEIEAKTLLGSPANVIYRSILKYGEVEELSELEFYIKPLEENKDEDFKSFSHLFLHYLGKAENYNKMGIQKNESNKVEKILDYCIKHNIQSMFDEYIHLLTDAPRYKNMDKDEDKIVYLLESFRTVFMLRPNEITIDSMNENEKQISSKFAMRISKSSMIARTDSEAPLTADNVKTSFNSPFAPFLLATTSIGQEGLDFHPYCHQIWHWDLPSNPVDLEQREGRIHRYKNYAVRKNVAMCFKEKCWIEKFEKAKKEKSCDFKTFWLFSTVEAQQKIERVVPSLPLSKDERKYTNLKKQVELYRKAIGQKRQSVNDDKSIIQISLKP